MNIQIFVKKKCFDSQKALRYFKERRIPFSQVDLQVRGMSRGELESVVRAVGGLELLVDPRHPDAALVRCLAREEDKLQKLLEQPLLLKTPIVRSGRQAAVGYCPEVWQQWGQAGKAGKAGG